MFSHADGLFDHEVKIFWELRGGTERFENTENFGPGKVVRFTDSVGISEVNTDQGRLVT